MAAARRDAPRQKGTRYRRAGWGAISKGKGSGMEPQYLRSAEDVHDTDSGEEAEYVGEERGGEVRSGERPAADI